MSRARERPPARAGDATGATRLPRASGVGPRWSYGRRGHALAQSLRQLAARPLASATTVLALGVTLALPALLWFSSASLDALAASTLDGESLTLYLTPDTSDLDGAGLAGEIAGRADVATTRYVSRDEALATFRESSDVGDALEVLGVNPLPGAVIVHPVGGAAEVAAVETLARALGGLPEVERVQVDLRWVERLRAALTLARRTAVLLASFLVLSALLVITNTIRLELARRRPELEVTRLLGADAAFVYRPTFYTAALFGALGGLAACLCALIALALLRGPAGELAALYGSAFRLAWPGASDIASIVAFSTLLGVLGALFTLYGPSRLKVPSGP